MPQYGRSANSRAASWWDRVSFLAMGPQPALAGLHGPLRAESGHLVVFDRSPSRTWEEKIFRRRESARGAAPVTVWGM